MAITRGLSVAEMNHTIPKGDTYIRRLTDSGAKLLGSNQQFPLTIEVTTLDHFSAATGYNEKDDSANISRLFNAEITVHQITDENLSYFLLGTYGDITSAGGAVTNETHTITLNTEIQLGRTANKPLGARLISAVSIDHAQNGASGWAAQVYAAGAYIKEGSYIYKTVAGGTSSGLEPTFPTTVGATVTDPGSVVWVNMGLSTLVADTDYQIDTDLGRIKILSAARTTTGESYLFDYTEAANTVPSVWTSDDELPEFEMEIISANVKGTKQNWLFPRVKLTPTGELSLKNEEAAWQTISFTVAFLTPTDGRKTAYKNGVPVAS